MMRFVLLSVVWVALSVATGCAQRTDAADWLDRIESAHQQADERLAAGDAAAARITLESALALGAPAGVRGDDAALVRRDLQYRLAEIELEAGNAAAARDLANNALSGGVQSDVFTANLFVVRGRAHEALGDDVAASRDYKEALDINERLLDRALGTEDPP